MHLVGHILYLAGSARRFGSETVSQMYFSDLKKFQASAASGVTRSSFSEARSKFSWQGLEFLLEQAWLKDGKWKGHVVRSVDGSLLALPNSEELERQFPKRTAKGKKEYYPRARFVVALDINTKQPTHADLATIFGSEREQAAKLLTKFNKDDILLLDRGFEGAEFFRKITSLEQHFVCRVKTTNALGKKLLASGKKDLTVLHEGQKIRLLLDELKEGVLVIATSLLGANYSRAELFALYKKRWEVETAFRKIKQDLAALKFHAKTENGVRQELFASLLMLSFLEGLIYEAQKLRPEPEQKINFRAACEVIWKHLPLFIQGYWQKIKNDKLLNQLLKIIGRTRLKVRPDRHFPRISKQSENRWIKARRLKNHVHKGHEIYSDAYR